MKKKESVVNPWYINFESDIDRTFDAALVESLKATSTEKPRERRLGCDRKLLNIILLGLGFCFTFGTLQVCMLSQTVILNSVRDEYFTGTSTIGYFCLAITFAAMGIMFILAPALSVLIGPKTSMVVGAVCITIAISAIVRPLEITLYIGAAAQGIGCGIVWTVYGHFLTENSTEKNIGRNTGIFWVLFEIGPMSLNLFYFFLTRGQPTITEEMRYILFLVLVPSSAIGVFTFCLLDRCCCGSKKDSAKQLTTSKKLTLAKHALRDELRMSLSKEMLLLIPMFIYMGVELTFFINVYGTSLGYSRQFGDLRESLVGLHGLFVAIGQLVGGLIYGLLGGCQHRYGRDFGIMLALLVHLVAFYIAFLVLPERAPFEMTSSLALLPPNPYLVLTCSFLFGFGDAGWNNPLFVVLGMLYPQNPVAAFAIFQAYQSFGNVVAFAYSAAITVPYQLGIMIILGLVGAFGFFLVDWKVESEEAKAVKMIAAAAYLPKIDNPQRNQQITVL